MILFDFATFEQIFIDMDRSAEVILEDEGCPVPLSSIDRKVGLYWRNCCRANIDSG